MLGLLREASCERTTSRSAGARALDITKSDALRVVEMLIRSAKPKRVVLMDAAFVGHMSKSVRKFSS